MNTPKQKLIFSVIAVLLSLLVVLVVYWQQKNTPSFSTERPSRQKQLVAIGQQQPAEPATVYIVTGQITAINFDQKQLTIITTKGEKTVNYSPATAFEREINTGRPIGSPVLALVDRNSPPEATQIALPSDLQVGTLIKVESLTNISGLSTFTVNKLTIID